MEAKRVVELEPGVSGEDALAALFFADPVFSQRYEGWEVLGRGFWATVVRTRSRDLGHEIALKVFLNLDPALLQPRRSAEGTHGRSSGGTQAGFAVLGFSWVR